MKAQLKCVALPFKYIVNGFNKFYEYVRLSGDS